MNYFTASSSLDGYDNLARDEFILNSSRDSDMTLYLYVNGNAVIIGRNQNPWVECNLPRMKEDGVQLVRRITGGGAVYHDSGNLNYSFICGKKLYDTERQISVIVKALKEFGIHAEVSGRNDMTVNGSKFSGNAFCERDGICQHHGTLLISSNLDIFSDYLSVNAKKLKAKGVKSVRARVANLSEFSSTITVEKAKDALRRAFESEYGASQEIIFDQNALHEIDRLRRIKSSEEWVMGETPAFDAGLLDRFSFGMLEIGLTVKNARVEMCRVYTDALDTGLPTKLEALLNGVVFETMSLVTALMCGGNEAKEVAEYIWINGIV